MPPALSTTPPERDAEMGIGTFHIMEKPCHVSQDLLHSAVACHHYSRLHTSNRACLSWLLFIPVQTCDWPSVNKPQRPRGAVHGAEIKDFLLTAPLTLLPMMPYDYLRKVSHYVWPHRLRNLYLQTCSVFFHNIYFFFSAFVLMF